MNNHYLTEKQYEVVFLAVEEALPAKAIAFRLGKSKDTVNGILKLIYRKLRINSNIDLSNWYYRNYYYLVPKNLRPVDSNKLVVVGRQAKVITMVSKQYLKVA